MRTALNPYNKVRAKEILAKHYKDIDKSGTSVFHGASPLHLAAEYNNEEAAEWRMDNGAEMEERDKNGGTSSMRAAFCSSLDVLRLLLSRGANASAIASDGWSAVHSARNSSDCMRLFLEHGAFVDSINSNGDTPLLDVCKKYSSLLTASSVISHLLEHDADPQIADNQGRLPRHLVSLPADRRLIDSFDRSRSTVSLISSAPLDDSLGV